MIETVMKDLVIGLSGLVIGLGAVSVYGTFRRQLARRMQVAWGLVFGGVAIRVGLITLLVFGAPGTPFDWKSVLYVLGLGITAAGFALLIKRDASHQRVGE